MVMIRLCKLWTGGRDYVSFLYSIAMPLYLSLYVVVYFLDAIMATSTVSIEHRLTSQLISSGIEH